jgi:hypothetical protein
VSAGEAGSTDREALRALFRVALTRTTDAGPHVYVPDDWPVQRVQLPALLVDTADEMKVARGRMGGIPQFLTTSTIAVTAYVQETSKERAKARLDRLTKQIEFQVFTSNDIICSIQQFSQVRSTYKVTAEGQQHNGLATLLFEMEYPQEYWPDPGIVDLTTVVVDIDLSAPFDATGTYTTAQPDFNADFPTAAKPAPRTSGPDGRVEGRLVITLP